jgi:hypothetical protein
MIGGKWCVGSLLNCAQNHRPVPSARVLVARACRSSFDTRNRVDINTSVDGGQDGA